MARLPSLQLWLKRNGILLKGVSIEAHPSSGLNILSTQDLEPGQIVIAVPESAVLSLRNLRTPALDALLEASFPAHAVLKLAVAHQISLGSASRFYGYLRSLEPVDLPIMWEEPELRLLAGSGRDEVARSYIKELRGWHSRMIRHLCACGKSEGLAQVGLADFLFAATQLMSRAFYVDSRHGDALVPGADLFNHRAAVLKHSLSAAHDDESLGGSGEEDEKSVEAGGEEEGEEEAEAGFFELEDNGDAKHASEPQLSAALEMATRLRVDPFVDCVLHNLEKRPMIWEESESESEGEEEDVIEGDCEREVVNRSLFVVTTRAVAAHKTMHIAYGDLSNGRLLESYGFTMEFNPFDSATLMWIPLKAALQKVLGRKPLAHRQRALRGCGWDSLLERGYVFDALGNPPSALLVLLWLMLVADSEGIADRAGAQAFLDSPSKLHLRTGVISSVLKAAIRSQIALYSQPLLESSQLNSRRVKAMSLVRGELQIWENACVLLSAANSKRRAR